MNQAALRIGYVIQDFPPETGAGPARVTELAREWSNHGVHVTAVTGMPNRRLPGQPDGQLHPDYRGRRFATETYENMRVLRSWVLTGAARGFLHTALNHLSFMATGTAHGIARLGDVDVVIASAPPFFVHPAGLAIARARRAPLVLEIRDLWPDYLVEMGTLRAGSMPARMLFGVERALLRRADHIVVVTRSFKRRVIEKGIDPKRITVLSNGVDMDAYYSASGEPPPLPQMESRSGEFVVGYLGTFGAGQALGNVIDAAAILQREAPHVRVVLAGDGPERMAIEARVSELRLLNVSVVPPIRRSATRAFYNHCDVCLVPLAPLRILRETVPSKLFEILACERPVVAAVAGEAAAIVHASGAGIAVAPGDAAALARAIVQLLDRPSDERASTGKRGRDYVAANYDRKVIAGRYLDLLQQLTSNASLDT